MRAYVHDGQEPHALHPKAGYIEARPNYSILTDFSCNTPPVHTFGVIPGPVDCLGTRTRSLPLHPQLRTCHWSLTPLTQCARTSPEHLQKGLRKEGAYSNTSSARERIDGGTVKPSALAALRLMASA